MIEYEDDKIGDERIPQMINDSELYSQLQQTHYNWTEDKLIEHSIDHNPNVLKSTYLDTDWSAITCSTSEYPILVTSFLYDCVGLALLSNNIVGLFHISTDISDNKIRDFVDTFFIETGETSDENSINTILYSGQLSPNLIRCREIALEKNLAITICAAKSKLIRLEDKIISVGEINLQESFGVITIDSENMQTYFSFDDEEFIHNYEHNGDMYTQATEHSSHLLSLVFHHE